MSRGWRVCPAPRRPGGLRAPVVALALLLAGCGTLSHGQRGTGQIWIGPPLADLSLRVHMVNRDIGWAVNGVHGPGLPQYTLLRSGDGGARWTVAAPLSWAFPNRYSMASTPSGSFWLAVAYPDVAPTVMVLRTARRGGTSLARSYVTIAAPDGRFALACPVALQFVDSRLGWMVVELQSGATVERVELLVTRDGGARWTPVDRAGAAAGAAALPAAGRIGFRDAQTGWLVPSGMTSKPWLFVTRDGGRTWLPQSLPIPSRLASSSAILTPPRFADARDGVLAARFVTAREVRLFVTRDGGRRWQPTKPIHGDQVDVVNGRSTFVLNGTELYHTSDGGRTWSDRGDGIRGALAPYANPGITSLQFVAGGTGWAQGSYLSPPGGPIFIGGRRVAVSGVGVGHVTFVTHNGGRSWSRLSPVLVWRQGEVQ